MRRILLGLASTYTAIDGALSPTKPADGERVGDGTDVPDAQGRSP
jgi:hypothetical protein